MSEALGWRRVSIVKGNVEQRGEGLKDKGRAVVGEESSRSGQLSETWEKKG